MRLRALFPGGIFPGRPMSTGVLAVRPCSIQDTILNTRAAAKKETPQTSHRQALPAGTFASVEGESIPQSPDPLVDSGLKRDEMTAFVRSIGQGLMYNPDRYGDGNAPEIWKG